MEPYELVVDGLAGRLRVHSLSGKEGMSEVWRFDITVSGGRDCDLERSALGRPAMLHLQIGNHPRSFYGIVSAVRVEEAHTIDGETKYSVRLSPRLWLLGRRKRSRIFQHQSVPEIVARVLFDWGIGSRFKLVRSFPEREYCTQYEETDLQFVRRLLAEAGIYFYFQRGGPTDQNAWANALLRLGADAVALADDQAGGFARVAANLATTLIPGDTLILGDDAIGYPSLTGEEPAAPRTAIAAAPVLDFMPNQGARVGTYDKVFELRLRNSLRPNAASFREFDPDRPHIRLLSAAVSTAPFKPSPLELAAMAAATAANAMSAVTMVAPSDLHPVQVTAEIADKTAFVSQLGAPTEVYEHHSPFLFTKWSHASDLAPQILRQERRRASVATGTSGCHDLAPAHRFTLHGHPTPQLDGSYAVIAVHHRGHCPAVQSATSAERAVYENTFDCVPASTTYPPKRPTRKSVQVTLTATVVGPKDEEIFVDDKGQIKVQFHWDREGKLDEESSCWIRTMQPWGGAGWGHQFIPRIGMEVVVTFEGGDPDKPMVLGCVYNGAHPPSFPLPKNKTRSGLRTRSSPGGTGFNELSFEDAAGSEQVYLRAQRDHEEHVGRNQSTSVGDSRTLSVGRDRSETIGNDQRLQVGARRVETIALDDELLVGGARSAIVDGDDSVQVKKGRRVSVLGDLQERVDGHYSTVVGTQDVPAAHETFAWGMHRLGSDLGVEITGKKRIVLRCGSTQIEMTERGISFEAENISLSASKTLTAKGDGPKLTLGDDATLASKEIRLFSTQASLLLDGEAKLDAPAVKLNCAGIDPKKRDDKGQPPKTKPLSVKLTDGDLCELAGKDYVLLAAGVKYEGKTSAAATVEHDIPAEAERAVLILWTGERPHGECIQFRISIEDLAPTNTVAGAKTRLSNLGYHDARQGEELDAETRAGLEDFQRDHGLQPTGELDDATVAALTRVSTGR